MQGKYSMFGFSLQSYGLTASQMRQLHFNRLGARMVKGTVSRDFLLLVLFMNQFPPSPWVYHSGCYTFFRKFAEIFAAQGWPPVSTTPVANQRLRRQTMGLISGCRYLKVNLKAKMYICVNSTIQRCPNKIIKLFWLKIFLICRRCQRHRWSTLSCEYLREFSKKFDTLGLGGNWLMKKKQKRKISWHCPFKT